MKNIPSIFSREMKSYFVSPIAYVALVVFVLLTGLNVMLALPVIWAALVRRWMLAWIAVAILFAVILTAAEPVLFEQVQGGSGEAGIFWRLNGVHFLWVFCSLGVIRLCGYRFERTKARG